MGNQRLRRLRSYAVPRPGERQASGGAPLLDLASNDTLGLLGHPVLNAAAVNAINEGGVGSGASRLVSGSRPVHQALEAALAQWLGRERVLLFPSGFQANIAALALLADRHTLVLADRRIHHSLLVGVQACGARLQRFPHNNLEALEERLSRCRRDQPERRVLVLSESLFSMEGSSPDVASLAACCQRHNATLVLDEAHALGVMGPAGRGLGYGIEGVNLLCGTFGKAFASGGAFLATDSCLGEQLLQTSGAFRYTTALAPPLAAAALASLEIIQSQEGEQRRQQVLANAKQWRAAIETAGWPKPVGHGPILAIKLGDDEQALAAAAALEAAGLLVVAIRPPTVPEGEAMLRISLRPKLASDALGRVLTALGIGPRP